MIRKLIRRIMSKIGRLLCRRGGSKLVEAVVSEVSTFSNDLNNLNWDMSKNGELVVFECLKVISPKVVFNVGAGGVVNSNI